MYLCHSVFFNKKLVFFNQYSMQSEINLVSIPYDIGDYD